MSLLRSIATVGGFTMLSRITGFARDILIAKFLGAGLIADAFFVAFKFPNLFRRLFAEGAFNAAFVPLFAGKSEAEGKQAAEEFAGQAFAVLLWSLAALIAVMEIIMPWAMLVFAPGFDAVPGKHETASELARITFPYLLFISLVSLQSGVLNSLHQFAAAAATPILLNLCLIAALFALTPMTESAGHALAWGTSIAGVVQFLWLAWHVRRAGYRIFWRRPRLTPQVKLLVRRIIPGAVGAGIYQINLLVDTILASLVGTGAVSFLYYADRINQLPLGVVGVAVGTALLPILSRQLRAGRMEEAAASQNRALEFALLLTLPSAAAFMALSLPIVSVLFQRGSFGAAEAQATALALAAFSIGLPAYVLNKVLTPGFFAREDTKTPVKVAVVGLVANIVLNLILMGPLGHVGIALATGLSSWLNVALLAIILRKRGHFPLDARLKSRFPKIILAVLGMALALEGGEYLIGARLYEGGIVVRAGLLALLCAGGAAVFFVLAQITGAARLGELRAMMRRSRPASEEKGATS